MGSSPLRQVEVIRARSMRLILTVAKLHAHILSPFEERLDTPSQLYSVVTSAHTFHGHKLTGRLHPPEREISNSLKAPCGGDILFISINEANNNCLCTKYQLREVLYPLKVNIWTSVPYIELVQGTAAIKLIRWIRRCKITEINEHSFLLECSSCSRVHCTRMRRHLNRRFGGFVRKWRRRLPRKVCAP